MEAEFWHKRWDRDEIGFHQSEVNDQMQRWMGSLGLAAGAHVLVPLCGKSLDMLWLAEQGYRVTGVELSRRAVEDFFAENGLAHRVSAAATGDLYSSRMIDILCGDLFRLESHQLDRVDAVYDRAALVALPPAMRRRYVRHMDRLVGTGVPTLLLTLDYPQDEMRGPPFSVPPGEVETLYAGAHRVECLDQRDCLVREPRFREKGLSRMDEYVFRLRKTAGETTGVSD